MEDDFDIVKIKKLFDVTQAVMINRNQLLEDAMNEAEVEAKKSLKRGSNFILSILLSFLLTLILGGMF